MKQPRPGWREPRPQLDLTDWLHAQANKLPWPGRLMRKRRPRAVGKTAARKPEAAS